MTTDKPVTFEYAREQLLRYVAVAAELCDEYWKLLQEGDQDAALGVGTRKEEYLDLAKLWADAVRSFHPVTGQEN